MRKEQERKPLDYYLDLKYPVLLYPAEEGGYVAEIEELSGCFTQGETLQEVMENIEDAKRAWIEAAYEMGQDIPLPRTEEEYSGRILLRLPRSLHRRLAQAARREGVSLNQYIVSLLARREVQAELINMAKELANNELARTREKTRLHSLGC